MASLALPTKFYQLMIKTADPMVPKKLIPLWNHAAGTIKLRTIKRVYASAKRVTLKGFYQCMDNKNNFFFIFRTENCLLLGSSI